MTPEAIVFPIAAIAAFAFLGGPEPSTDVHVDTERGRVVVTVSPLHIPATTHYHHEGPDEHVSFIWPEDGWLQGYRVDLVDPAGNVLPRAMLHHAGVADLARRQLAHAGAERLIAVGSETEAVTLPSWMGMRMSAGQRLVVYYALVNESGEPIDGASLRITVDWRSASAEVYSSPSTFVGRNAHALSRNRRWMSSITEVVPLVLNADPNVGGPKQFDIPTGVSVTSAEISIPVDGHVRALGAHMHDYGTEMRLEDAETGEVLVTLRAERDAEGRLVGLEQTRFGLSLSGLRLHAHHRYRVVGVYDNPTGVMIPGAAMAYMAGPFIPDDPSVRPAADPNDPMYRIDVGGITGEGHGSSVDAVSHHIGHSELVGLHAPDRIAPNDRGIEVLR